MWSYRLDCFVLLFFVSKCSSTVNTLNAISDISTKPIQNIATNIPNFIDVAAENGYRAERHEVTTEDGYILTMHRIPPGKHCKKKTPLLAVHGLLQTSEAFIDSGPAAPAFSFANDCYDAWYGNFRGNYHSRSHVCLDPDKDLKFWKFSLDELGLYDTPAMIDHVLNVTNSKKLIYVGYSEGGGSFYIMNSERPEYASKASLFVGLAPVTRTLNIKSAVLGPLFKVAQTLQVPLEAAGVWEVLSKGFPVQAALSTLCQDDLVAAVLCGFTLTAIDSAHPDSITPVIERRIFQHFPAGTSVQLLARYGQSMDDEHFSKFDYGPEKNMQVYGSSKAPQYNFKAVKVPAVIYHGHGDRAVNEKDVDWAVNQLPNVLGYIKIEDPLWNHVDMMYSRYWNKTIYVSLRKYLSQYDNKY